MRVVMRAGEVGGGNYWGWEYGRGVYRGGGWKEKGGGGKEGGEKERVKMGEGEVLEAVTKWCFLHPRDVSGWAFVVFLLREKEGGRGEGGGGEGEGGG